MPEQTRKTIIVAVQTTIVLLLAILIATSGCGWREESPDQDKPQMFVSVAPLAYFARRIAGKHITVNVLIAPGGNPHTYTPTPKQVVKLSRGGLLLCAGSDFGQIISSRLSWGNSQLRVVNVAKDIETHDHHGHGGDNHVWMSPKLSKTLASGVCLELCKLDPPHADDYRRNLRQLHEDLDDLDVRLAKILAPFKGRTFFVFHPAFGHLAEAYGLKQEAVEHEGKSPGPRRIGDLIDRAKSARARAIFVQPQFSHRAAAIIADKIGGEVVVLDPLSADYINNLEHIAEELQKALQQ
ncbi:MAG: zinc ABC transporter substrate-binding protein [Phycisphaerae bacterium]|jgi:zinc transport system substrate-binding protein|nr:zinc ABC transporter substrate-binding protein [Phycisphaerae bacterium]